MNQIVLPAFSFVYCIPYIILFLFMYINTIPLCKENTISLFKYNYGNWFQYSLILVTLIIFFGFRGFIQTDWFNYYPFYMDSPTLFDDPFLIGKHFQKNFEIGFLLYTIVCKTISANYFFFQFISTFIDIIILFYFFKRIIPRYIVLGFLFYFLYSGIQIETNLLRNSKAFMLFLISLKSLEERNIVKYMLLNSLGALFHISAIIYIPLYFLLDKKINKFIILTIFVVGNIIYLLQIEWLKMFLLSIISIIPGRMGFLIEKYLSSDFYSNSYGISIGYLERSFSFILIYSLSKKLYGINKNNRIYINIFYLYCFIFLYFSEMKIILQRVAILFVFPYWILYPQLYSLIEKKLKLLFLLILFIYGLLKTWQSNNHILALYDNVLFPYSSFQEREVIFRRYIDYILGR